MLDIKISAQEGNNTFIKGHTYYFEFTPSSNIATGGNFLLKITGSYQTASSVVDDSINSDATNNTVDNSKNTSSNKNNIKLTVTFKKGNNVIKVSTLKNTSIMLSMNKKIIYKGKKKVKKVTKSSNNGTIKIKLSRKLKAKDKVVITIKKNGYVTKKYSRTL